MMQYNRRLIIGCWVLVTDRVPKSWLSGFGSAEQLKVRKLNKDFFSKFFVEPSE